MQSDTPGIDTLEIQYKGRLFHIEYFIRNGTKGTILFVHGLGGAKENFLEALKVKALNDYTLISFDNPCTGNSTYYNDLILNVDDLATITDVFVTALGLQHFILAGASMGGLITLRYLDSAGLQNVKGYINIEGNLMPEDCMFSSKVVSYSYDEFIKGVFPKVSEEMKQKGNTGYHIIANNVAINTNPTSYYYYSFQTVEYSATGKLLDQFININIPKLFIYGDKNEQLSYLPKLRANNINLQKISGSDHFVFYDNPKEMYEVISAFVQSIL